MSYFTLNHGYNWCYYYELVFIPQAKQNKKKIWWKGVWFSLTFLEHNADKEIEGWKIKCQPGYDQCSVSMKIFFFQFEINACDGGDRLRERVANEEDV